MWHVEHSTGEFRLCRNRVAVAAQSQSSMAEGLSHARRLAELLNAEEIGRDGHDADRVEQVLAGDRELVRRYELVRQELAETTCLNEALGAPSARAMEKLFAAINAEEVRAPRRRRRPISRTRFLASTRDSALIK
jgi:hypothetical protein